MVSWVIKMDCFRKMTKCLHVFWTLRPGHIEYHTMLYQPLFQIIVLLLSLDDNQWRIFSKWMTKLHSLMMFVQESLDLIFELSTYPEPVEFELSKEVAAISDWLVWWRAEIKRRLFFIRSWNKFNCSEPWLLFVILRK